MANTRITQGVIKPNEDYDVRHINATGIISATNLNLSGVLTYEDVTNVDSIGIITARSGFKVLAGGANVVGVITARTDVHLEDYIYHLGDLNTKIGFPAADTISFETGGTERARFTSNGLCLGGTGSANGLDDYEEGDWTPSLSVGSPTYVTQVGKYTKIGELVLCSFYLDYSNGASSSQRIAGLPFAPDATREGVNQVSRLGGAFDEGASQGSRAVHSISFTSQGTTRIYVDLLINVAARGIRGTLMYRAA